jgi:hypothetical protein
VELFLDFCKEIKVGVIPADSSGDKLACPITMFDVEVAA